MLILLSVINCQKHLKCLPHMKTATEIKVETDGWFRHLKTSITVKFKPLNESLIGTNEKLSAL
jgi:hypothetical protein